MLGLMVLLATAVYLIVSALVVWRSARWAKNNGRRSWLWGLLAAFVMYNVVFWAWIPSLILQDYYCKTEGGAWLYKTPKQWAQENPNENPIWSESNNGSISDDGIYRYDFNERVTLVEKTSMHWPSISRNESTYVDKKTKEVLLRKISFRCGSCGGGGMSMKYLFIPQRCKCDIEKSPMTDAFIDAVDQYKTIKGKY